MWWYALQGSVIGVLWVSNEVWHWTPNRYLAGLIAVGTAVLITDEINRFRDRRAARRAAGSPGGHSRRQPQHPG
jgi:hypothetical protein